MMADQYILIKYEEHSQSYYFPKRKLKKKIIEQVFEFLSILKESHIKIRSSLCELRILSMK